MKVLNPITDIFARYFLLILVALPNLYLFYYIFAPLTIYPVYFFLNIFFDVVLIQNFIVINQKFYIEIIEACIAGAAYYFLFLLNLSTPKIKIRKRILMLLIAFSSLLFLNVTRILILSFVFLEGYYFFDLAHKFLWYVLSTAFVILIWFAEVKLFKIKEIPFYSDLNLIYKKSHLSRIR